MSQFRQMTKGRFHVLLWQRILTTVLIAIQFWLIVNLLVVRSNGSVIIQATLTVIGVLAAFHAMARKDKSAYKLTMVFLILLMPIVGGVIYILFNMQMQRKGLQKKLDSIEKEGKYAFLLLEDSYDEAIKETRHYTPEIRYLQKYNGFPVYQHTQTQYYATGESAFKAMITEMEKAEKYIFMEFFIVEEGVMWDAMLEILKQKASQGVDVRLIYDDLGCLLLLPSSYRKTLQEFGISSRVFNPYRPFLTTLHNNRDHRKILSIDGKVAFTGGLNIADEYINQRMRFGHWKDSAVMLKGYGAWSLTLMFLEMWSLVDEKKERYEDYLPWQEEGCWALHDGFVQPYSDSPMDMENVSEHVYLRIIEKAQNYLYITTPYLVVDSSLISALVLAAKSGVDVRIITPYIPDKKLVHFMSRSYYRELIQAGVRIFEYTNGFIHSKTFVSDDEVATVGTVNMDFRSLYLHFECGVCMYGSRAVKEVHEDFLQTLRESIEITKKDCHVGFIKKSAQDLLRIFAPLI